MRSIFPHADAFHFCHMQPPKLVVCRCVSFFHMQMPFIFATCNPQNWWFVDAFHFSTCRCLSFLPHATPKTGGLQMRFIFPHADAFHFCHMQPPKLVVCRCVSFFHMQMPFIFATCNPQNWWFVDAFHFSTCRSNASTKHQFWGVPC